MLYSERCQIHARLRHAERPSCLLTTRPKTLSHLLLVTNGAKHRFSHCLHSYKIDTRRSYVSDFVRHHVTVNG